MPRYWSTWTVYTTASHPSHWFNYGYNNLTRSRSLSVSLTCGGSPLVPGAPTRRSCQNRGESLAVLSPDLHSTPSIPLQGCPPYKIRNNWILANKSSSEAGIFRHEILFQVSRQTLTVHWTNMISWILHLLIPVTKIVHSSRVVILRCKVSNSKST